MSTTKFTTIEAYECPVCGNLFEEAYEARECCGCDFSVEAYRCDECYTIYPEWETAQECCAPYE